MTASHWAALYWLVLISGYLLALTRWAFTGDFDTTFFAYLTCMTLLRLIAPPTKETPNDRP